MAQPKSKSASAKRDQRTLAAGVVRPDDAVNYDLMVRTQRPSLTNLKLIFDRCRVVASESSFLSVYLPLKRSFFNYGFQPVLGPMAKGKQEQLDEWLKEEITTEAKVVDPATNTEVTLELLTTRGEAINKLVDDIWWELFLLDNCVVFWMDDAINPTTIPPEKCEFTDKFGIPVLFYEHGLKTEEIKMFPPEQQTRFQTGKLLLDPEKGEHFKVIKRAITGAGFGVPSLYSIFRTLGEIEAKEYGFYARSQLLRAATRHHKVGHEISNGPHAGKPHHFWSMERHKAITGVFDKRQGPHDFTSNFDHEIEFPWPDMAVFDEVAWKGTDRRLRNWGGPVGQMVVSEQVIEGGLNILKAQAESDRKMIAAVALRAITAAYKPDESFDLKLAWSDLIFNEPGQAADLIKFAFQNGLSSVATTRRLCGMDHEKESQLKLTEADDTDAVKKFRPSWDASHALAPQEGQTANDAQDGGVGPDPSSSNGRPKGSKTGSTPAPTTKT